MFHTQRKRTFGEKIYVGSTSFLFFVFTVLSNTPVTHADTPAIDPLLGDPLTPVISVETIPPAPDIPEENTETATSTEFLSSTNPLSSAGEGGGSQQSSSFPLEITNTTTESGETYEWQNGVDYGELLYTDRPYTIEVFPGHLYDQFHLKTANDDKFETAEDFLNFDVNQDVTVYVAFDVNATALPDWLSDWETDSELFGANVGSHMLYHRDYNVGTVTLGGNNALGSQGAASNYVVVVVPKGTITQGDPDPIPEGSFLMNAGDLVIDAENFTTNTAGTSDAWTLDSTLADFSGTGYFESGPDSGNKFEIGQISNSPHLSYDFYANNPGTYYVWVRGYRTGMFDDSIHVGLDGVAPQSSNRIDGFATNQFSWTNQTMDGPIATLDINDAGSHTLDLWMREDGFILDKFMITDDPTFVPTGHGPPESIVYTDPNTPPVVTPITHDATDVDAGTPGLQVHEGTAVTYSSSATDGEGDPLTWEWLYTVDGGPEISFGTGSGPVLDVSYDYSGVITPTTFQWILRVSDGSETTEETLTTDVLDNPTTTVPPVVSPITHDATDVDPATAGLQIYESTVITYSSSASDGDGDPLTWEWLYTLDGGPETLFLSGSGDVLDAVFDTTGVSTPAAYQWILRVTDGTDTVEETINTDVLELTIPNTPPTVSPINHDATDVDTGTPGLQINEGTLVTLSATASDDDGDPLNWEWLYTVDGGPEISFSSGTDPVQDAAFDSAGISVPATYNWILRVNDGIETIEQNLAIDVLDPSAIPDGTFLMNGGLLVMEAENFLTNTAGTTDNWALDNTLTGASGDNYFNAGPNTGNKFEIGSIGQSPHLEYQVHVDAPGTYYVWVRGHAGTIYDDSLHVGLDGVPLSSSNRIDGFNFGEFSWTNDTMDGPVATIQINDPGVHTLDVWMREDGFSFDKILLTDDPNLIIEGVGPNESLRQGEDPPVPDPTEHDQTGIAWDVLEWSFENFAYTGNPFDLDATATFVHQESGETRNTEMFYDEDGLWKLRFPSTKVGTWDFTTSSVDADLDGMSGTVTVQSNPDGVGFLTNVDNKFAREVGDNGDLEGYVMNVYQNFHITTGFIADLASPSVLQGYLDDTQANGMNAISFIVNNNWFQFGAEAYTEHNSTDPDPMTFELLETIINTAHAQDIHVHLWMWGDEERQWTPIGVGGINGTADLRIQRYIASRLGPIPGWSIGYGFDLHEWVTESEVGLWADNIETLAGWDHLLMARDKIHSDLDAQSIAGEGPDTYWDTAADLDLSPGRPTLYEERFMFNRWNKYDMETTRRTLWRNSMAGGAGAWWGFSASQPESAYPNPEQLVSHHDFWDGRFLLDFERANSLTDGFALKNATDDAFVFYKEDSGSIQLDLSGADSSLPAIALDTTGNYVEIDLGLLSSENQTWTAPYTSDWAIAVGTIVGPLPPQTLVYENTSVFTFDGVNQHYIENHTDDFLLDQGSIKVRFKADTLGSDQGILSKDALDYGTGGHVSIWIGADDKVHARIGDTTADYEVVSATSVQQDQWIEAVLTFGDQGLNLYLDGFLEASDSYLGGLGPNSGGIGNFEPLVLGGAAWSSADLSASPLEAYFDGMIDLVEFHNQQITP